MNTKTKVTCAILLGTSAIVTGCAAATHDGKQILGPTLAQVRQKAKQTKSALAVPKREDSEQPAVRQIAAQHLRTSSQDHPKISDGTLHSLELRGATLAEALHLISSMAGVNVYLDPSLDRAVDASFPAVTLDAALSVLLDRNDLRLVEEPAGIYWVDSNAPSRIESSVFELESIRGEDVLENVSLLIGSGGSVALDTNQNFLVVRGARQDLEAVGDYLSLADQIKPQVLIEMEILEVSLDESFELGVQQLLQDPNFLGEGNLDLQTNLGTAGNAFSAVFSLNQFDFNLTLEALSTYGAVELLSSPKVLAITNTVAKIEVITEIPYIQTTSTIDSSSTATGISSQETVSFKEAGIKLNVTPVVQDGNVIQLTVDQEFSEVVDFFQGVPVLDARTISNQFLVGDQDAVVIGGLIQSRDTKVDRGVPVLMHLPLVGRLFRSDDDVTVKRELLVLITPHVLGPQEAAKLSGELRSNYSERRGQSGIAGAPTGASMVQSSGNSESEQ